MNYGDMSNARIPRKQRIRLRHIDRRVFGCFDDDVSRPRSSQIFAILCPYAPLTRMRSFLSRRHDGTDGCLDGKGPTALNRDANVSVGDIRQYSQTFAHTRRHLDEYGVPGPPVMQHRLLDRPGGRQGPGVSSHGSQSSHSTGFLPS